MHALIIFSNKAILQIKANNDIYLFIKLVIHFNVHAQVNLIYGIDLKSSSDLPYYIRSQFKRN